MDKMLVAIFHSESNAYEGSHALNDLDADGSIVLYAVSVIAKDSIGAVSVKHAAPPGLLNDVLGAPTGSLIRLLGASLGLAKGGIGGSFGGSLVDLDNTGIGADFLDEVSQQLQPGKAAVVAEIEEEWVIPLDTIMESLGGLVFRRARKEIVDAQIQRDVEAFQAEIDKLEAELSQVSGQAKDKLEVKIQATRARLEATKNRGKARAEELKREAEAKIISLQEQAAIASGDLRAKLEERLGAVRTDYVERARKLSRAWLVNKPMLAGLLFSLCLN